MIVNLILALPKWLAAIGAMSYYVKGETDNATFLLLALIGLAIVECTDRIVDAVREVRDVRR